MPWTSGRDFADRHNTKLTGKAAAVAKGVAEAMLKKGAPEGEAIATANKLGDRAMSPAARRYAPMPKADTAKGDSHAARRYRR